MSVHSSPSSLLLGPRARAIGQHHHTQLERCFVSKLPKHLGIVNLKRGSSIETYMYILGFATGKTFIGRHLL